MVSSDPRGAFSCDFQLPLTMDPGAAPPIIERDRMYMAARPGLQMKHIPFIIDPVQGGITTGGRYLFDTVAAASHYRDWVVNDFVLDGTHFFDRDYFIDPVCHTWAVIGAVDFAPVRTQQQLVRTERFAAPASHTRQALELRWETIRDDARQRGLSGVRLLYNHQEQLIEILHLAARDVLDIVTLGASPTLGLPLLLDGCQKSFDRTQFVLTIWFPFILGDHGEQAPYPSSPPLPAPSCGDGVCEVSRGESGSTCAGDCPPDCGDSVCQPGEGESTHNCPGDCRLD